MRRAASHAARGYAFFKIQNAQGVKIPIHHGKSAAMIFAVKIAGAPVPVHADNILRDFVDGLPCGGPMEGDVALLIPGSPFRAPVMDALGRNGVEQLFRPDHGLEPFAAR